MSAAGLRLRLCPFCGSEATLRKSGAVFVVVCDECKAEGPAGIIFDFADVDADGEWNWEQAEEQAKGAAIRGWNGRPGVGRYYPDELDSMSENIFEVIDDENTVR